MPPPPPLSLLGLVECGSGVQLILVSGLCIVGINITLLRGRNQAERARKGAQSPRRTGSAATWELMQPHLPKRDRLNPAQAKERLSPYLSQREKTSLLAFSRTPDF